MAERKRDSKEARIEHPTVTASPIPEPQVANAPPAQIGPYKILRTLGEGGMGTVYLAEQTKPIHRQVALKIIKLGMDTRQVIARFDAEREALALMNHPNVARVIDAGATETGRPFFVMEYVEGVPLTAYCDAKRLSTHERLDLFVQVCQAIQHAHQKGIIHRDIKPSNVLVMEVDGKPAVKVIDFGIAKATQQRLTEATCFTEQGQLIGTPAYMSPEQADARSQDIDTRTDIYSLGVLLYEMLVGELPFDAEELRRAALTEIVRIIREVDPPKPSTRLAALGATSTTIADLRGTTRIALARQLRGDLDWIVMKALEKDRTRRYETANALVLEIHRYLNNEPVLAGPPSAVYRIKKFARRNKGPVAAVTAIFAVLIAGMSISTLQRNRAINAEHLAQERLEDAEAARQQAEAARQEAEQVTQFLTDTLAAADPSKQGKDVSVREVLDKASEQISEKFAGKPLLEARLRGTVGWTFLGLGLFDRAEQHLADAATIYQRVLGANDRRTLAAKNALATCIGQRGKYSASEALLRSTLEIQRRVLGEEHPDTLRSMNNLGNALLDQGRDAEPEELYRKTLEIQRRLLGEEHPDTLRSMNNLGLVVLGQARLAEAEELYRKTLEIQRRVLGEEHPDTLRSMNNLGNVLKNQARYAEADELARRTLEIKRRVLGEEHPETLGSMSNLGSALSDQGRYAEAEELHRKTLEIQRRILGEEHLHTLMSMHNLTYVLFREGRYAESEELCRKTLEIQRRVQSEEHPDTLGSVATLANVLLHEGRYAEAEELYRKTLEIQRRVLGLEHPDTVRVMSRLPGVLLEQWQFSEAEELAKEALAIWEKKGGATHVERWLTTSVRGGALTGLGRFDEAEPLLVAAYEAIEDRGDLAPADKRQALDRIVRLYESWDASEPGKGYADKAAEWRAKLDKMSKSPSVQKSKSEDETQPLNQEATEGNAETWEGQNAEKPKP